MSDEIPECSRRLLTRQTRQRLAGGWCNDDGLIFWPMTAARPHPPFCPRTSSQCNGILMSHVDNDGPVLGQCWASAGPVLEPPYPHSSLLLRTFCQRTMFSHLLCGADKKCKVRVGSSSRGLGHCTALGLGKIRSSG